MRNEADMLFRRRNVELNEQKVRIYVIAKSFQRLRSWLPFCDVHVTCELMFCKLHLHIFILEFVTLARIVERIFC